MTDEMKPNFHVKVDGGEGAPEVVMKFEYSKARDYGLELDLKPFTCEACGARAIGGSQESIFRFVPKSETKSALFCKGCAGKVEEFVQSMIAKRRVGNK